MTLMFFCGLFLWHNFYSVFVFFWQLVELEKLVKEEIKLRDKSERKLKFLRKKLESFSKSSKSKQLGHSDSSQNCENSCGSSSISSNSKYSEANETQNPVPNQNVSETQNSSSTTKDYDSQITDDSSSNSKPSSEFENLKNDESRYYYLLDLNMWFYFIFFVFLMNCFLIVCFWACCQFWNFGVMFFRISSLSTKSSVTENENDHADSFDNSLALVPVTVNVTATSQATATNHKQVNESVFEALDALRVAKEKLQSSLGIRQMIRIGLM